MAVPRKIAYLLLFLIALAAFGTLGYMILLNLSFLDGLYMTIITISTVGYTEVAEMTKAAQIFSIVLIITSVGTVGFVISRIGYFFKEGHLYEVWRKSKMEKDIQALDRHYIICGSGETGKYIMNAFKNRAEKFVVIDKDPETIEELKEMGCNYIMGDATHEDVLQHAGIDKAAGLVASLSKDADNVFVVLTARQMNAQLNIVARAIEPNAHTKLKRAGADHTVSPNEIGGRKMAAMLLKPSITYFMDSIIHTEDITLDLEEIQVSPQSTLCKKPLKEARISSKTGLIVLAIRKEKDERFRFNPGAEEMLDPNDKLIVIGQHEQIETLRDLAKEPPYE